MKKKLYEVINSTDRIKTTDFCVLLKGDKFKKDQNIFIKKTDDYAINIKIKVEKHFWPQDTIYFLKPTPRNVLYKKYPILEYLIHQ